MIHSNKSNKGLIIGLVVAITALVAVIGVLAVVLLTRDRVTDTGATTARTRAGRSRTDTGTEITQDEGEISPLSVVCTDYAWELTLENDEGEDMVYDIHYITPGVTDEAYPALQKSLDQFAQQQREALRNDILLQSQDLYLAFTGEMGSWITNYYCKNEMITDRADSAVLSFAFAEESYYGGAHGSHLFTGYTLDSKTGEEIRFSELVRDREAFAEAVYAQMKLDDRFDRVCEYYDGTYDDAELKTFEEQLLMNHLTDDDGGTVPWTLTPEGIHVWFGDYMLGAYAMGTGDVVVPFADYPDVFTENEYTKSADVPEVSGSQLKQVDGEYRKESLADYCQEEGGFILTSFRDVAGVYSCGAKMIELDRYGYFSMEDENGERIVSGIMRMTPGAISLYESRFVYDPDLRFDDGYYGSVALIDGTQIDVTTPEGTERYLFHTELSAKRGHIDSPTDSVPTGEENRILLSEEDMDGEWINSSSETQIILHAWRGEFEVTMGTTGDYHTGTTIYHANSGQSDYTLVTEDGYELADFFFYETSWGEAEMQITFHFAGGDQTMHCHQPKG